MGLAEPSVVLDCLAKIEASKGFRRSERIRRFLRYVVERTSDGRLDELREFNLGVDVYDRGGMFDPSVDNIVRVDATRLRSKLADYYEGEGKSDPVWVELPKGAYVAQFSSPSAGAPAPRDGCPAVAVMPFVVRGDSEWGEVLTDEITAQLGAHRRLRVAARSAVAGLRKDYVPEESARSLGVAALVEGSVRASGGQVRVNVELIGAESGF